MGNNQSEREYEEIRLKQTISLAEEQLHSFPTRRSSDLGRASCRERV